MTDERAEERAAVVAWLDNQIAKGHKKVGQQAQGSISERNYAAGVVAIERARECIERGDHVKDK